MWSGTPDVVPVFTFQQNRLWSPKGSKIDIFPNQGQSFIQYTLWHHTSSNFHHYHFCRLLHILYKSNMNSSVPSRAVFQTTTKLLDIGTKLAHIT